MKLTVSRHQLNDSPENFLHRAGFGMIFDSRRQVSSFVRRLGSGHYPRLHLYFDIEGDNVIFNIHLDQKEASYSGGHMHNAEYDSPNVAAEIARLRDIIGISTSENISQNYQAPVAIETITPVSELKTASSSAPAGDWRADLSSMPKEEKSWWQKLFS